MLYQILAWIIVGAIAGSLASALMGERHGCLANTFLGILGGVVGGFIWFLVSNTRLFGISLAEVLMAAFGSIIVLMVWRSLAGKRFLD